MYSHKINFCFFLLYTPSNPSANSVTSRCKTSKYLKPLNKVLLTHCSNQEIIHIAWEKSAYWYFCIHIGLLTWNYPHSRSSETDETLFITYYSFAQSFPIDLLLCWVKHKAIFLFFESSLILAYHCLLLLWYTLCHADTLMMLSIFPKSMVH
jgi:hypothetical protein